MPQISAIPFFHDPEMNTEQGARALPLSFSFSTAGAQPAVQNFAKTLSDVGLQSFQMIWIDNSASPGPTTIIISGTRQTIVAPAFSQGYYRVLGSPLMLDFQIANFGGVLSTAFTVNLLCLNIVPDGAATWTASGPNALQGSSFVLNSFTPAAVNTINIPAQAGRRTFITYFAVTGSGATAASQIGVYLANMDNLGVSGSLYFDLQIPAGASVPIVSLTQSFNPPLPVVSTGAAALVVPSFGAGNTAAAVTVAGFYL